MTNPCVTLREEFKSLIYVEKHKLDYLIPAKSLSLASDFCKILTKRLLHAWVSVWEVLVPSVCSVALDSTALRFHLGKIPGQAGDGPLVPRREHWRHLSHFFSRALSKS